MALTEYLRGLAQFKKDAKALETQLNNQIFSPFSILRDEVQPLHEYQASLEAKRSAEHRGLFEKLAKFSSGAKGVLQKVKQCIELPGNGDLSQLQTETELLSEELARVSQGYSEELRSLQAKEEKLNSQLAVLLPLTEQWEPARFHTKATRTIIEGGDASPLQQEAAQIHRRVQALGGLALGWDWREHQDFVALHSHCSSDPAFFEAAQAKFVSRTEAEILEHFNRYTELQQLLRQKKKLLQQWKETKKQALPPRSCEEPKPTKTDPKLKEKIAEWKEQKANAQRLKEAQEQQTKARERKQQQKLLERAAKQKELVRVYKENKDKKPKEPAPVKSGLKEEDLQRIQAREEKLVREKKQRVEEFQQQRRERVAQLLLAEVKRRNKWAYVESRVNAPTAITQMRTSTVGGEVRAHTFAGDTLHHMRRGIPNWRIDL